MKKPTAKVTDTTTDETAIKPVVEKAINERIDVTASFEVTGVPSAEDSENIDQAIERGALVTKGLSYGEVEVIVSNSSIDRYGESITMEGIDLTQIKRNPVVLWGHQYSDLPIGQITKLWRKDGNLMARIKLDTDLYEFANTVYQMILRGTINAVSIGGIVKEWSADYITIVKMEMIELSVVPVGAHPDALVTAKSLGIEKATLQKQFDEFVQKALLDKYKAVGEDELNNHIETLEKILVTLKQSKTQRDNEESKETIKVKLITLKRTAGEAAYEISQLNKTIKIKLKEI